MEHSSDILQHECQLRHLPQWHDKNGSLTFKQTFKKEGHIWKLLKLESLLYNNYFFLVAYKHKLQSRPMFKEFEYMDFHIKQAKSSHSLNFWSTSQKNKNKIKITALTYLLYCVPES